MVPWLRQCSDRPTPPGTRTSSTLAEFLSGFEGLSLKPPPFAAEGL